jgi:hypothetical protein
VVLALIVVIVALVAGGAWYVQPQPLLPEAASSLASTVSVTYAREGDRYTWMPADGRATTGLIVYPGGKVPAAAYGPLAAEIAAKGFLVEVVAMPFNLAVFGIDRADATIAAHPEIERWAIGGHSLGGSMAAQYASGHRDAIDGLVLWASYAATDLSSTDLRVLSVWGSLDAGAARMSGVEARTAVPDDAVFLDIPGGNHEQMAWYTGQPNDPPATISRVEQQARVAGATVALLVLLEGP